MTIVQAFQFNAFQENTYIIIEDGQKAMIIDPGCATVAERQLLDAYIDERALQIERIVLTHAHIDHILGLAYVCERYDKIAELHLLDRPVYDTAPQVAELYHIEYDGNPDNIVLLDDKEPLTLGATQFDVRHTPGHSPGSISLINHNENYCIVGDALFKSSIGRTDLPGGDHETLLLSIHQQLLVLPDDMMVYSGHGPSTTIGDERRTNPFLVR